MTKFVKHINTIPFITLNDVKEDTVITVEVYHGKTVKYKMNLLILPSDKGYVFTACNIKSSDGFYSKEQQPRLIVKPLNVVSFVNDELKRHWTHPNVTKAVVVVNNNYDESKESVYLKDGLDKYANKPVKMKSKNMNAKKSSVKRMTGNIEALGKNFGKLI